MQHRGSLPFDTDDVGSIGPGHGDGNIPGLQLRRLSGGQSRETKTGNQEAALPNELSISFHFAPTKISAPPAETQENSFAWTLPGRVRPALCFSKNVLLVTKRKRGDFHTPVHQGQLVELVRGVIAVGKTSMTVKVELFAE